MKLDVCDLHRIGASYRLKLALKIENHVLILEQLPLQEGLHLDLGDFDHIRYGQIFVVPHIV